MSIDLEKSNLGVGIADSPDDGANASATGSSQRTHDEHCHCHHHDGDENYCDFCHSAQKFFDEASKAVNDAPDTTGSYASADIGSAKPFAVLSYLGCGLLFFLPLAVTPKSEFGKFHANQSLILLICTVMVNIAFSISTSVLCHMLPGFLDFFVELIAYIPRIASFIYMVIGIVNAAGGKARELPYIGSFKLIK